jgi:hypothetical protein
MKTVLAPGFPRSKYSRGGVVPPFPDLRLIRIRLALAGLDAALAVLGFPLRAAGAAATRVRGRVYALRMPKGRA